MLRVAFTLAVVALLTVPADLSAQDAKKKKKKRAGKKADAKQKSDQPLAPSQMTKEQLLEKYDANKDGKLDSKERKEIRKDNYAARRRAQSSNRRLTPFQQAILREFDKDKNGQLDEKELQTARQAIAKKRQDYFRQLQQRLRGGGRGGARGRGGRGGGARGGRGGNPLQQFQQFQRRLMEQRRKQQQARQRKQ